MPTHSIRSHHTLATVLFGAVASLAVAGCTRQLDSKKLENFINDGFKTKGVELRSLACPKHVKIKQGDKFDCEAVDAEGKSLVVHVEQTDNTGTISWKLDGMIVNQQNIGKSIEKKVGASASITCPATAIILRVNESVTCDATVAGAPHKVAITLTDADGSMSWKITQ